MAMADGDDGGNDESNGELFCADGPPHSPELADWPAKV